MKKVFAFFALFSYCALSFGQDLQKGCVRTPERYIDKKFIKAVHVPGVEIEIEGRSNPVVSGDDGRFDFHVSGGVYRVRSVYAADYSLLDMKILNKDYPFSPAEVFEILVTNPEEDLEFQLVAARRARDNYKRETERLKSENERLLKEGKITEEQYRKELERVSERYNQEGQWVKDFAEEYTKLDFKDMDDYNRQFHMYRMDGDFEKLDSLQKTRGNILKNASKAKEEYDAISEMYVLSRKRLEGSAQECYNSFLMYKDRARTDSAGVYIENRARMDSLNPEWQYDAAAYFATYGADFEKALQYYEKSLSVLDPTADRQSIAKVYNDIANVYVDVAKYDFAHEYFKKALDIQLEMFGKDHFEVVCTYVNLAGMYFYAGKIDESREYYEEALRIGEKLSEDMNETLINVYIGLGGIQHRLKNYHEALNYFNSAGNILDKVRVSDGTIPTTLYMHMTNVTSARRNF